MNCEIIAVGTEVTTGDISNTNAAFLSRHLTSLGIEVTRQAAVDDNAARITEALAAAVSRSQIIIFTGGLGPTPDDLTKETVSAAVGRKLVKNEESLARIQSYYDARGSVMPEMNVKQAYFPEGCRIFPNHHGTADGCVIQSGNQHIIMLPGPPSELCPMFEESVREYLLALLDHTIVTKTLKVFGIGESSAAETISDLLERPSPTVATYVGEGGDVRIKVTAVGDRREDCEAQCEEAAGVIRERLGDKVYDDAGRSLPEVVIARLTEQNKKIATAESCTAGLLSKTLTDVSGASQVFEYGISAYANRVKTEMLGVRAELLDRVGAVSPEVAEAMARGARSAGKADLAIGITGVAGPDGGTAEKPVGLVYVCLFDGTWFFTRKLTLPPARGRDSIRITTVMNALDMVRLYLDSNPAFLQTGRDQNGAPPPAAPAAAAALASEEPASEEPASEEPAKAEEPSKVKAFLKSIFPWKGDSTGQKIRKIILIVCVVVFVCSAGYIIDYVYQSIRAHGNNERLTSLIDSNISELDENGINKRFYNLLEINPDTVGWLKVPNTKTDNPVVQAADNEKYLKTTFEGETSKYGAIFADSRNVFERGAVLSTNTILYGHHMKDGEMMGELKKYRDLDFYKANPWVEFTTIYSEQTTYWKVFSVFVINTRPADDNGHVFDYLHTDFHSEALFLSFINECYQRSIINTASADVVYGDKILTLSTCVYDFDDARLVIMARQCREGESREVDTSAAVYNPDPVYPAAYYSKRGTSGRTTVDSAENASAEEASSAFPTVSSRPTNISIVPSYSDVPLPDSSVPESSVPETPASSEAGSQASSEPPPASSEASSEPASSEPEISSEASSEASAGSSA